MRRVMSRVHSLQVAAVNNAAIGYYLQQRLDKAASLIEVGVCVVRDAQSYIVKDPENNMPKDLIETLVVVYRDLYTSQER